MTVQDAIMTTLSAAISLGTVYLFAALGEILTERSGIMNLGVEGMILFGAISAYLTAGWTHSLLLGVLGGMLAGGILAGLHAVLSIRLKVSQVVSGLALATFGTGLAQFIGTKYINSAAAVTFGKMRLPLLADIPVVGPALFNQSLLVYVGYLLVILLTLFLFKTKWGLRLRAVGENPAAADAAGVNVFAYRYFFTMAGGMLAGLSGAYITLSVNGNWQYNPSNGAGWIAVALVIFALWKPSLAMAGSILFGLVNALLIRLQIWGVTGMNDFMRMLPYLATVVILVIISGKVRRSASGPASLGIPYDREAR